ncbi:hypothetical protein N497_17950 [Clostridium botulinum F 357]|nr:hypothetical protein N497_17950 [Clostridium botulinum F 357]
MHIILSISTENLIKIFSIIITCISTYFIAKYNSNTPRKLEIKQKQFDKVYLPIYKLLIPNFKSNISKELALNYINKMRPILWENYELAYPQLHKLLDSFSYSINLNGDYQSIFEKICYQVQLDYNLLKKSLGYPSENSLSLFKRMSFKDKVNAVLGWVNVIMLFNPILFILFYEVPFIHKNYIKLIFFNYTLFALILYFELNTNKTPTISLNK